MMQQTKLKTKQGQNSFHSNDTFNFKFYLLAETLCIQESSSIEVGNARRIMVCIFYFMDIMLNPLSLDSSCLVFEVSGNMQVI